MGIHEAVGGKVDEKDVNQEIIRVAMEATLRSAEKEVKDLREALGKRSSQVAALEAEIFQLRLRRTDDKLAVEVLGLRKEVAAKDRTIRDNLLAIEKLKDSEVVALQRAKAAEQKLSHVHGTMEAMQRARDASQARQEAAERSLGKVEEELGAAMKSLTEAEGRIKDLEKSKEKSGKKEKPVEEKVKKG